MRIKTVRIQNFRALRDVEIEFDSVTTFIGPNGTGKSTVLHALDWFFNGKQGQLSDQDISKGSNVLEIEVRVTFDNLSAKDRIELGKYVPPEIDTFTAWKIRNQEGSEILSANSKSYEPFNEIREQTTAGDKKERYNTVRKNNPSLNLPVWTNVDSAMQSLVTWEASNTELLVESPEALQTNFFGFNSAGKMSGLFDYVLVPADLRASEESVDAKTSIIGRILEQSVDRASADEEIAVIVEEARLKQQKVYEEKFRFQLDEIQTELNGVVNSYSPARTVNVTPADIELKAPKSTFVLTVFDGPNETPVERQGHGFQRTLLISALQLLAQTGTASGEGVICLAIEEPELFQHPVQAQAFSKVLRALADDDGKNMQVVYATHSPYFLEPRHFDQVRRLTRCGHESVDVVVSTAHPDAVKRRLAGCMNEAKVMAQLDHVISKQLSVALFSNRVLLVEGPSDAAVFYGIGDKNRLGGLELDGISIVSVGGKDSLPITHAILAEIGIPVYSLFDADAGYLRRGTRNGKNEKRIEEERVNHSTKNRKLLSYFGLAEEDFPATVVTHNVAIFEDHLESYLDSNWPEWKEACNKLEEETGVNLSKNQDAYRTSTLMATSEPPQMLLEILSRLQSI